ncbi:hypothetical protein Y032_0298g1756 [Ancylostoma ceylanicum]|uniref:Uncharacterized protein n=1 Tax=Ancylostoma ceylanicum TaxID=53326 RepID=A0A016S511_9BILA|nr:hypothetical protein Y032_0298g1756 [Ancylostoma ceylanicum]
MDTCFNLLNQQFPHIQFTREKPRDNWLAFLNVQLARRDGENTGRHENGQACSRRQLDIFCRVWLLMKLGYNATPMFVQF